LESPAEGGIRPRPSGRALARRCRAARHLTMRGRLRSCLIAALVPFASSTPLSFYFSTVAVAPAAPPPAFPPPLAPEEACHSLTSTHGSLTCVQVYVHSKVDVCTHQAAATCDRAAAQWAENTGDECVTVDAQGGGGFMWGMTLSIVCDIIISIGLAVQKVAHNRLASKKSGALAPDRPSNGSQRVVTPPCAVPPTAEKKTVYGTPVWWIGMLLTIGGEVGNFVAYGDVNTPASVVTAVGCVGVISNVVIATGFLGERFRWRDVYGAAMVVGGVLVLVAFAPQQSCTLTKDRFYWLIAQPAAISLFVVLALAIGALYFLCPKHGHTHVLWNLSMASLIGSVTVMASKAVSTFAALTLSAIVDETIPFSDRLYPSLTTEEDCLEEAGYSWRPVNDSASACFELGAQQLDNPALYLGIIVMAATGVAQVKYINRGMELFGNSEVIPCHYVTFTLFSILSTTIVYQEFTSDNPFYLHLFLDGCLLTFCGVRLITTGRCESSSGASHTNRTHPNPTAGAIEARECQVEMFADTSLEVDHVDFSTTLGEIPTSDGRPAIERSKSLDNLKSLEALSPAPSASGPRRLTTRTLSSFQSLRQRRLNSNPARLVPSESASPSRFSRREGDTLAFSEPQRRRRRRRRGFSSFLGMIGCASGVPATVFIPDPADGVEIDLPSPPPTVKPPPHPPRGWSRYLSPEPTTDQQRTPLSPQAGSSSVPPEAISDDVDVEAQTFVLEDAPEIHVSFMKRRSSEGRAVDQHESFQMRRNNEALTQQPSEGLDDSMHI